MDNYSSSSDPVSIIRECISKLEQAASSIEGEERDEGESPPTSTPTSKPSTSTGGKFAIALAGMKKGMSK